MTEIITSQPERPVFDAMQGAGRREAKVDEHGFVALIDCMPRLIPQGATADAAIVQAARVSYGDGTKKMSEDRDLIRYLYRNHHTTPFEMVEFKFHQVMPIFIARQWIRHRTASVNEYSARYSVVKDRFFRPTRESLRKQSTVNKQGREGEVENMTADQFYAYLQKAEGLYAEYSQAVDNGVAREIARIGLPLSCYTEWYWKCDLRNLLHFLGLRVDSHAQYEMRQYAGAMLDLIRPIVPLAVEAFEDYHLNAMRLSAQEIEAIRTGNGLASTNKREQDEWADKKKRLGLA